jgi:hypothetical protein
LLQVASAYSAIPHSFKEKVKIQAYYLLCCTSSTVKTPKKSKWKSLYWLAKSFQNWPKMTNC